jgi:transposase
MARHIEIDTGVRVRSINLSCKLAECPKCGASGKRNSLGHRWIREISFSQTVILEITYSKHYCPVCERYFNRPMDHLAMPGSNYTNRVHRVAIDLVTNQGLTPVQAKEYMLLKYHVNVPFTTIQDWVAIL